MSSMLSEELKQVYCTGVIPYLTEVTVTIIPFVGKKPVRGNTNGHGIVAYWFEYYEYGR